MSAKNKPKRDTVNRDVSWHKSPNIIALISILFSTLIGVISIWNSNSIARLDRDVYVPRLQYRTGPATENNYLFIEVLNYGAASANDITVTINWKPPYYLNQCKTQPPYQDVQPVLPIAEDNLTFRFSTLPIDGTFKVICEIATSPYTFVPSNNQFILPLQGNTVTPSPPTEPPNAEELATAQAIQAAAQSALSNLIATSISSGQIMPADVITVQAFASNSRPAIEVGSMSIILTGFLKSIEETTTPTITP